MTTDPLLDGIFVPEPTPTPQPAPVAVDGIFVPEPTPAPPDEIFVPEPAPAVEPQPTPAPPDEIFVPEPAPAVEPEPAPEAPEGQVRAFWVDAFHAGIKTPEQVAQLVRDVQAANANTIIAQVRRRGDSLYNRTLEPRAAELRGRPDFDPLASLIEAAHAATPAIEVHAWIAVAPVAAVAAPPPDPQHIYHRHGPAAAGDALWLSAAEDGSLVSEDTYLLDLGHPAACQHIVDVALSLVRNYDLDGLHLDRVRYGGPQFGYNPVSVARFCAASAGAGSAAASGSGGSASRPASTDPAWQQWRRDQVTHLVRQIYLEAISLKPQIKVSAATVPWGAGPTSDEEWRRGSAMTGVYQDWLGWLREGIVDMVLPMNYDREADARQRQWFDRWIEWEKDHRAGRHLVIGLGAFLNEAGETVAQARRALAPSAGGEPSQGVCFYSYAATNSRGLPLDAFAAALAGSDPAGDAPLFGRPAPAPRMPWKAQPTAGSLKGFVRNPDGTPGDGLAVTLDGPSQRTVTASGAGFYGATGLAPGVYTVTVARQGLTVAFVQATVQTGRVTTVDIGPIFSSDVA